MDPPLELNAAFDLLGSSRRRYVLYYLTDLSDEPAEVAVDVLAEHVAACEAVPGRDADEETVARVRTALRHVHLPKLADAGVVDYDPGERTVTLRGTAGLDPLLDAARTVDRPGRLDDA